MHIYIYTRCRIGFIRTFIFIYLLGSCVQLQCVVMRVMFFENDLHFYGFLHRCAPHTFFCLTSLPCFQFLCIATDQRRAFLFAVEIVRLCRLSVLLVPHVSSAHTHKHMLPAKLLMYITSTSFRATGALAP